jgi:8-oxo-dGTP diphosphatase
MRKVTVVCAVIEQAGRVLACRRNPAMSRGGLWEFPGGKVEQGEEEKDALKRELEEELGIQVTVGAEMGRTTHCYEDMEIDLIACRCVVVGGNMKPVEHDRVQWVSAGEAMLLDWAPADVPLVEIWLAGVGR